jgi:hypothetical protein
MGIDNNNIAEDFTPDPISLLESSRSLGYSIEEAISDLIDNSISANAKNIVYEFHWNVGDPFFLLKDDGNGMTNENDELVKSFRLGSKNPLEERDSNDLGRFGFGMKTASLSQARTLTVITKKRGCDIISRSLDLKFIAEIKQGWKLKKVSDEELKSEISYLNTLESGTIIKWSDWDRAPSNKNDFVSLISNINNYLGVCFHRYIEKGVKIYCHETQLIACSPIPIGEGSTKYSEIKLSNKSSAKQTAFILQHPKFWKENYENISQFNSFRLFEGFERQQGIYIYRCDRLLTPKGGWLGLISKGNSAKLARVVIEYPNNADSIWSLDVTKTNASIPFEFKAAIKDLIEAAQKASFEKIARGNRSVNRNLNPSNNAMIWKIAKDNEFDSFKYSINTEHPICRYFVSENLITEKNLIFLAQIFSNNIPISDIIKNNDEDPSKHDRMFKKDNLSEEEIKHAKILYKFQCTLMTKFAAFSWLLNFEPYCYYEMQLKKELNEQ